MNDTIKKKQLQFSYQDTIFRVKIQYDTSLFSEGQPSFWETELFKVNDTRLIPPLTYRYTQSRGWLLQIPKFREHRYICSTRRKEIEDTTNLYPLAKDRVIYQWHNRKAIEKYEKKVSNFNFLIEQKYEPHLIELKEQKRELKQRLKVREINNKQYQKLYTPIRKEIDKVEFHIWNVCRDYENRYFSCDKLKEIYRVLQIHQTLCYPPCHPQ